jgi:hypothetical protein
VKLCTKCETTKDSSLFYKRTKSHDGLSSWCKDCFKKYDQDRAPLDRERKARNRKTANDKARNYILNYLSTHSCVDCFIDDPIVLEFDHKDDCEKSYNISEMLTFSVERIKLEIDKCDVRCANCHRKRTAKQFGFWKNNRV